MDNETIEYNETEEPLDCGLCIKIETRNTKLGKKLNNGISYKKLEIFHDLFNL